MECGNDDGCNYYTFDSDHGTCWTHDHCNYNDEGKDSIVTYEKYGRNYLHSAMVKVNPGDKSVFKVDGTDVTVRVPEEDGPSSGIVWADPCVSDRWKPCALVDVAMERSKEMLNALSKDDTWTYFGECLVARKGAGQGQAAIDIFY